MNEDWGMLPYSVYLAEARQVPYNDAEYPPIAEVTGVVQPIVRIPVAGPAPYNTLAVVRGRQYMTQGFVANGQMKRGTWYIPTKLIIPGFRAEDPVDEQLKHSSSASIHTLSTDAERGLGADGNTRFTIAVDQIQLQPSVSASGAFGLIAHTAFLTLDVNLVAYLELSSWVLYRTSPA